MKNVHALYFLSISNILIDEFSNPDFDIYSVYKRRLDVAERIHKTFLRCKIQILNFGKSEETDEFDYEFVSKILVEIKPDAEELLNHLFTDVVYHKKDVATIIDLIIKYQLKVFSINELMHENMFDENSESTENHMSSEKDKAEALRDKIIKEACKLDGLTLNDTRINSYEKLIKKDPFGIVSNIEPRHHSSSFFRVLLLMTTKYDESVVFYDKSEMKVAEALKKLRKDEEINLKDKINTLNYFQKANDFLSEFYDPINGITLQKFYLLELYKLYYPTINKACESLLQASINKQ